MKKVLAVLLGAAALAVPSTAQAHHVDRNAAQSIALNWARSGPDCRNAITTYSCDEALGGGVGQVSTFVAGPHTWVVNVIIYQRHLLPGFGLRHFCRGVLVYHYHVSAATHRYSC